MGVNSCDRSGCTNIMCDTLMNVDSDQFYICGDCKRDLDTMSESWPSSMSKSELNARIKTFMRDTQPGDSQEVNTKKEIDRLLWESEDKNEDQDLEFFGGSS